MENSLKGLLLAAGTIITCIIIGLGFYIAREARDTASSGAGQINRLNAEFTESDKSMYDGIMVSGSEVVNVINKFKNDEICIKVQNKKVSFPTYYIYNMDEAKKTLTSASTSSLKNAQSTKSDFYINPNAQFSGLVLRDANNVIIGIYFDQV